MDRISEQASATPDRMAGKPALGGYAADVHRRGRDPAARLGAGGAHARAARGASGCGRCCRSEDYVNALGALTGNQAVQQVRAGLKAIYLSGWQVAADANLAGQTYPDQSLYPANSVPAGRPADQQRADARRPDHVLRVRGRRHRQAPYWMAPIVADAEAGFGGVLNAYELMKGMIAAGAAGVHWEDQLASEKKCGHLGGKVLIPTGQHIKTLNAARLAADVLRRPVAGHRAHRRARRDADHERRRRARPGVHHRRAHRRGLLPHAQGHGRRASPAALAYAPYADLLWMETSTPDLEEARQFAEAIKAVYPDQMLSYNCSPSFNWRRNLDDATIAKFQRELGAMGYKFQFITLAGFHALNYSMFELATGYAAEGMPAYVELQEKEFAAEAEGYTATRHQREVGTGYFDLVASAINPDSSTVALAGSTESEQFTKA